MGSVLADALSALGAIPELRIALYAGIAILSMVHAVRRPWRSLYYYASAGVFATFIFLALALALGASEMQQVFRGWQSINLMTLLAALIFYTWRDWGRKR